MRRNYTKALSAILLALLATALIAMPIMAYLYRAPVTVNNTGSAYTMLPVIVNSPNAWMAANAFMEADALDTRIETPGGAAKPHMVADNKTLFALALPATSQTNLYFTTGNSDLTSMPIITGYGGYVTITDNATLEVSSNFSIELADAYVGEGRILSHYDLANGGFLLSVTGTDLSASRLALTDDDQTVSNDSYGFSATTTRQGVKVSDIAGISSVQFKLFKVGSATGTMYARVRKASDDTLIGTLGSIDVSTIAADPGDYYTFNSTPLMFATQEIRISLEYDNGTAGDTIKFIFQTSDVTANENATFYNSTTSAWSEQATFDATYQNRANLKASHSLLAVGVSGEHDIVVSGNTTTWEMYVDGAQADTSAITAIPDSSANWIFGQDAGSLSYATSLKISVGGDLVAWYQPIAIISGAVLPDRQGAAENGVITWGANPAGVTAALGSMVSTSQPSGSGTTTPPADNLPTSSPSDWYGDGTVTKASTLANPLRGLVTFVSDNTSLSEIQAWRWGGFAIWIIITFGVAARVRGHQGITAIVSGAVLGGLVAFDNNIFPLYMVILAVGLFIGGIVAERSPSL